MAVGARCHMLEKFDAQKTWKELLSLDELRPNVFMGVPTVYVKLLEYYDESLSQRTKEEFVKATCKQRMRYGRYKTVSALDGFVYINSYFFRVMISGSAALPVNVLEKWELITGHRLLERYGMTEIGMALSNPLYGERKPGYVGLPFQSVKTKIADMVSREKYKTLAEGTWKKTDVYTDPKNVIGDLLIKGPSVFKEYWGNKEATAKEFTDDGWFITGMCSVATATKYSKALKAFKHNVNFHCTTN